MTTDTVLPRLVLPRQSLLVTDPDKFFGEMPENVREGLIETCLMGLVATEFLDELPLFVSDEGTAERLKTEIRLSLTKMGLTDEQIVEQREQIIKQVNELGLDVLMPYAMGFVS